MRPPVVLCGTIFIANGPEPCYNSVESIQTLGLIQLKAKEFLRRNAHLICLGVFTVLLLVLNRFLYMQGDDYYHASAAAGTVADFVQFHIHHYLRGNGRALIHFFITLFFVGQSFTFWKIANPFLIAGVLFVTSRAFAGTEKERKEMLICLCALFLTIGGKFGSWGVYSMAPVFNYLYPLALVYTVVILLRRHNGGSPHKILLPVVCFFAGATMEQTGIMAIGYLILISIQNYMNDKKLPDRTVIVSLVTAAIGYLTVMLAPGNHVRMGNSTNPFGENFVAAVTMALNTKTFLLINLCMILCLCYWLLKLRFKNRFFNFVNVALCLALVAGYAFNCLLLFRVKGLYFDTNAVVHLIWVLYDLAHVFALIYVPVIIMIKTKNSDYLMHAIMALGSVFILFFASVSQYRPLIPAVIELFVFMSMTVTECGLFRSQKALPVFAALLVLAGCSYGIDLKGYAANCRVREKNHALIQEYIQSGQTGPLHLIPYADEDTAGYSCNAPGTSNNGSNGYTLFYKRSEHLPDNVLVIFDKAE